MHIHPQRQTLTHLHSYNETVLVWILKCHLNDNLHTFAAAKQQQQSCMVMCVCTKRMALRSVLEKHTLYSQRACTYIHFVYAQLMPESFMLKLTLTHIVQLLTSSPYCIHSPLSFLKSLIKRCETLKKTQSHLLLSTTRLLNTSNQSLLTNRGIHNCVFLVGQVVQKNTRNVITFFPSSPDCIIRNLASGRDLVNCQGNQL